MCVRIVATWFFSSGLYRYWYTVYYILTHFGAILVRQLALFCIFNLAFYTAKHWVDHAQFDDVSSLIPDGIDLLFHEDWPCFVALCLASRKERLEAVKLLLEYKADPNHQDSWGWSALRTASANGQDDVAQLPLSYGVDPNSRDADQNAPLHMASFNGRVAAIQVLLEYDSHVDARDTRGGTPLHDAAQDEYLEVTLLLLKHGADVNVQKGDRSAVLHVAGEVVELLRT